jgi:hypothetical protein
MHITTNPLKMIMSAYHTIKPKATVPKSSPAPRDNSVDCSLNRHEITVLVSYIHAHNHKSTEDDNVSIPYH